MWGRSSPNPSHSPRNASQTCLLDCTYFLPQVSLLQRGEITSHKWVTHPSFPFTWSQVETLANCGEWAWGCSWTSLCKKTPGHRVVENSFAHFIPCQLPIEEAGELLFLQLPCVCLTHRPHSPCCILFRLQQDVFKPTVVTGIHLKVSSFLFKDSC